MRPIARGRRLRPPTGHLPHACGLRGGNSGATRNCASRCWKNLGEGPHLFQNQSETIVAVTQLRSRGSTVRTPQFLRVGIPGAATQNSRTTRGRTCWISDGGSRKLSMYDNDSPEKWSAGSASALWDFDSGRVLYADGIHTEDSLRSCGKPLLAWLGLPCESSGHA